MQTNCWWKKWVKVDIWHSCISAIVLLWCSPGVPNLWLMSHLGSFRLFGWLILILADFDTLLGANFTGPIHPCTRYIRHMYSVYKFIVQGACIVYVCMELSSCGIHRAQRLSPCCLHATRRGRLIWFDWFLKWLMWEKRLGTPDCSLFVLLPFFKNRTTLAGYRSLITIVYFVLKPQISVLNKDKTGWGFGIWKKQPLFSILCTLVSPSKSEDKQQSQLSWFLFSFHFEEEPKWGH